jgi:hypothetical protein
VSALPAPRIQARDAAEAPQPGDVLHVTSRDGTVQRVEVVRVTVDAIHYRRTGLPGFTCSRSWSGWRRFCRGEA